MKSGVINIQVLFKKTIEFSFHACIFLLMSRESGLGHLAPRAYISDSYSMDSLSHRSRGL